MTAQGAFAALARSGGRGALVTVLAGGEVGAKLLVDADGGRRGSLGDPALDQAAAALGEDQLAALAALTRPAARWALALVDGRHQPRFIACIGGDALGHSEAAARRVGEHPGQLMSNPSGPSIVVWSEHARAKAQELGASVVDIEDGLLASHRRRTANPGAAHWKLRVGPWAIAYDHPAGNDRATAKIVTLWRP